MGAPPVLEATPAVPIRDSRGADSQYLAVLMWANTHLGFVNAYCTTMPGLLVMVAVLALLAAASIVLDRMVPDEPAGKHARAHARERRS